jgi:hypothetical protein
VRGVLAGRGAFLRPALSGCHCSASAGRGCEGDELGSLWKPPPTDWNQRAVGGAGIEARRCRAGIGRRRRLRRGGGDGLPARALRRGGNPVKELVLF